jgi:hypothetical protein
MANPYSIFLMSQLAVAHGIIDKEEAYDTMWDEAQVLLKQFEESKYNIEMKSEHDCISDFLADINFQRHKLIPRPSDRVINNIINELDAYARDFDGREYGLPIGVEHERAMRTIVKVELNM